MPFFSVIIPLYNKENYIEQTLKSVLNQTFQDFEIIVVNDGSTDNSENIVLQNKDSRIRYFSKENQGVAVARNTGIKLSQADYICFLDADDYWYPDFLETMKFYIDKFPDESIFSGAFEIQTSKNIFPAQYSIPKNVEFEIVDFFDASQKKSVLWTSSIAVHKSVFENVGKFDEKLKISEDTDLWIRIGLSYKIVFIRKILSRYVFDGKSISRNATYAFEDYFFEKYKNDEVVNQKFKKYLDLNRFSTVIKMKLTGNHQRAEKIKNSIDLKNLSFKKRFLLNLPTFCLATLIKIKQFLADVGIGKSVFK